MRKLVALLVVAWTGVAEAHPPPSRCTVDGVSIELPPEERHAEEVCEALEGYVHWVPTATTTADVRAQLLATTFFSTATCTASLSELTCRVAQQPIVRDVDFEGWVPFALLKSDLRRRLTLRRGTMVPDLDGTLETQAKRLEEFLSREGYFGATVRLEAEPVQADTPNAEIDIVATVTKGWSSSIRDVRLEGDDVLGKDRIESVVRHKTLGLFKDRFQPELLDEDIDEITGLLQKAGWPAARVRGRYEVDDSAKAVDLIIHIQSGPKLVLSFAGNEALDSDDLEDAVDFSKVGVVDSVAIDESLGRIRQLYQEEGFHEAEAKIETRNRSDEKLELGYRIEEGERVTIAEVRFEGTKPFAPSDVTQGAKVLTKSEATFRRGRWRDDWIAADVRGLKRYFRSLGYPKAEASARKERVGPGEIAVVFTVDKGTKREVESVRFEGLPSELASEAIESRLELRSKTPFDEERLPMDRGEVLASLAEGGYTRAAVEQRVVGDRIIYQVEPGTRLRFGGVVIRGAFRTSSAFIEDRLGLEPGQPLDLVQLGKAKRELRALGIFSAIDVEALPGTEEGSTWLLVGVQESDARTLDLAVSFSTDDLFAVGGDFRDRNLFGRAWNLDLTLRFANASEFLTEAKIGYEDRLNATLRIPTPFSAPFDVEATAKYEFENRDLFEERRVSAQPALVRELLDGRSCLLCPKIEGAFGYELALTNFVPKADEAEIPPEDVVEDATIGRFIPRLRLEGIDNPFDPTKGYKSEIRFDFANNHLAPGADAAQFWRVMGSLAIYLNLGAPLSIEMSKDSHFGGPLVIGLAGTFGTAGVYGEKGSIPTSETFYYGGDQSVRGLSRRASTVGKPGATNVFVASLELRWYMLPDLSFGALQLAGFVDLGTVSYELSDLFVDNTISVGPAIRLVTPVGPISFAYGIPVLVDPDIAGTDAAPDSGRLHVTFGYSF